MGIVPVRSLTSKQRSSNIDSKPNSAGIVPFNKKFKHKSRTVSFVQLDSASGIGPPKLFWRRLR
jgi:hypothetical protein